MSYEEILITHDGYTDTAYPSCGTNRCTVAILLGCGAPARVFAMASEDINDIDITPKGSEEEVSVTVARLGEQDGHTYCMACGESLQHGLLCGTPEGQEDCDPEQERDSLPPESVPFAFHLGRADALYAEQRPGE